MSTSMQLSCLECNKHIEIKVSKSTQQMYLPMTTTQHNLWSF